MSPDNYNESSVDFVGIVAHGWAEEPISVSSVVAQLAAYTLKSVGKYRCVLMYARTPSLNTFGVIAPLRKRLRPVRSSAASSRFIGSIPAPALSREATRRSRAKSSEAFGATPADRHLARSQGSLMPDSLAQSVTVRTSRCESQIGITACIQRSYAWGTGCMAASRLLHT